MKRALLRSTSFVRAARKFVARNPKTATGLEEALRFLSVDAFDPRLKTHKLKDLLKGPLEFGHFNWGQNQKFVPRPLGEGAPKGRVRVEKLESFQ